MRKIDNLVHYDGQWMTGADRLARRVYKSGNRRNVVARKENGKLTGFYVINDEGETSLIEIRQFFVAYLICGKGRSDTVCTPEADLFRFREQEKIFDLMVSYGKGSDNSRTGTAKIAQSIVESNVILGGGGKQDPDMCGERRNQDGWRNRDANTVQGRSLTLDLQEMTGGDAGEKAFKKHITKGRGVIPQIKVPNGY